MLRDWQRRCCLQLQKNLIILKSKSENTEGLRSRLTSLHSAFLRAKAAFAIVKQPVSPLTSVEKQGDATYCACGSFRFAVLKDKVLGFVDDEFQDIEPFFVNARIDALPQLCAMYEDYETRPCDYCGEYIHGAKLELPIGRSANEDYISAYHNSCKENNK